MILKNFNDKKYCFPPPFLFYPHSFTELLCYDLYTDEILEYLLFMIFYLLLRTIPLKLTKTNTTLNILKKIISWFSGISPQAQAPGLSPLSPLAHWGAHLPPPPHQRKDNSRQYPWMLRRLAGIEVSAVHYLVYMRNSKFRPEAQWMIKFKA